MPDAPLPVLRNLILCDHIHVDRPTTKHFLLGIIDRFYLPSVPKNTIPFAIYVEFGDIVRDFDLRVEIADVGDVREPVFNFQVPFQKPGPNRIPHASFFIGKGITVSAYDTYAIRLYVDGQFLADRTFKVLEPGE